MPDLEVFGPGNPSGRDEELDTAPRRRVTGWMWALAVAVAVALAVVAVVHGHHGHRVPASVSTRPPRAATSSMAGSASPSGLLVDLVADPHDHRVIALIGSRLFAFGPSGAVLEVSGPISQTGLSNAAALSYDATDDVVWVVHQGLPMVEPRDPGAAQAFAARSLHKIVSIALPAPSSGSTALSGSLYVIANGRLYAARPSSHRFRAVVRVGLDTTVPIADPVRHRLLLGETGGPLRLASFTPGSGRAPSRPVTLPFGAGEVVVTDGTIWAGGTTPHGAVLTRLAPRTLRPVRNLAGTLPVGHSLVVAAAGRRALFVRPIRGSSSEVLCLDARTGALRSTVRHVGGLFAALGTQLYVDRGVGLTPIGTGGCPG